MSTQWPPPFLNMSIEEMIEQLNITSNYYHTLHAAFKDACKAAGHVWESPTSHHENEGGVWVEGEEGSFASRSGYQGGEDVLYFKRMCRRCGAEDKQKAIKKYESPFKEQ